MPSTAYTGFPYPLPFFVPGLGTGTSPATGGGISPEDNTQQVAVDLLRSYLKTNASTANANVSALLQVFGNETDQLETTFQALYYYRQLPNAYGIMLDNIGAIVGLPRNGLPDATYQAYLYAQVLADNSGGTTEDLNGIFRAVLTASAPTVTFDVEWQYTAAFVIYLTDPNGVLTVNIIAALAQFMREARGAAIDGILEYSVGADDDTLFSFQTATDTNSGSPDYNGPTGTGIGLDQGIFRGATN